MLGRRDKSWVVLGALLAGIIAAGPAFAQEEEPQTNPIDWEYGPGVAKLGDQAEITLAEGYVFANAAESKKFLELTENIPSGLELGILANEDLSWFAIFEFDPVGYVKDDEKDSLDADAMLESIQSATEQANEEHRRRGWSTITVLDWIQPPHYDPATNNLEWSTKAQEEGGGLVANHNTRYLGRHGVMRVTLVGNVENMDSHLVSFHGAMDGFSYTQGNNYASYVEGDKLAEYGLTALVAGGAAAALAKTGFLKSFWKIIVAGIVALGAALKRIFGSKGTETA